MLNKKIFFILVLSGFISFSSFGCGDDNTSDETIPVVENPNDENSDDNTTDDENTTITVDKSGSYTQSFVEQYGLTGNTDYKVVSIGFANGGISYLAGYKTNFEAKQTTWIAKYDYSGNQQNIREDITDLVYDNHTIEVDRTDDSFYITGQDANSSLILIKYNSSLQEIARDTIEKETSFEGRAIETDLDNNAIYVAGHFTKTDANNSISIVKFKVENGTFSDEWSQDLTFTSTAPHHVKKLRVDGTDLYLAGNTEESSTKTSYWLKKLSIGTDSISETWSFDLEIEPFNFRIDENDNVYINGRSSEPKATLLKVDSSGNKVWEKTADTNLFT
jgi:hypothetical protein